MTEHSYDRSRLEISEGVAEAGTAAADSTVDAAACCPCLGGEAAVGAEGLVGILV